MDPWPLSRPLPPLPFPSQMFRAAEAISQSLWEGWMAETLTLTSLNCQYSSLFLNFLLHEENIKVLCCLSCGHLGFLLHVAKAMPEAPYKEISAPSLPLLLL